MQRLHDDLFVRGEKFAGDTERAGDRGRRHEAGVIEHPDLLRRVADAGRIVDHQSLALDALEQMRRGDIAEVEGRILAHQHHVGIAAEVDYFGLAGAEMIAGDALHGHRAGHRPEPPVRPAQILGRIMEQPMPARLRAEHDRKAGIALDIDRVQRIHLHGDGQAHAVPLAAERGQVLVPAPARARSLR